METGMTSPRTTRKREADQATSAKTVTTRAARPWFVADAETEGASAAAPEWELWQSVEPLRQAVLANAAAANADSKAAREAGPSPTVLNVQRELLRPLEALPRPLTLDEVKPSSGRYGEHATQAE